VALPVGFRAVTSVTAQSRKRRFSAPPLILTNVGDRVELALQESGAPLQSTLWTLAQTSTTPQGTSGLQQAAALPPPLSSPQYGSRGGGGDASTGGPTPAKTSRKGVD